MKMLHPLEGIRVLDISHIVAGPFCSMLLADAGAEVIKIENPNQGEYGRGIGPFASGEDGDVAAACFLRMNRNKKGITINLKEEKGKRLFLELVKKSDVVVENFKAGTLEKLGLDYERLSEVNPQIIVASITGFGQKKEGNLYWNNPAFNLIAQAMSGIMDLTGYKDSPPLDCALPIGDLIPGLMTAFGIMQAILYREKTGKGQHLDVSMYDVLSLMTERSLMNYQFTEELAVRGQENHIAPHSAYRAQDGYFVVDCYSNKEWNAICQTIGYPELIDHEEYNSGSKRALKAESHIRPMIEGWAKDKSKVSAAHILVKAGVGAAPVQNTKDILNCKHLEHRKMLVKVQDPIVGEIVYPGNPLKFSNMVEMKPVPAPRLGQDNDLLMEILGLDEEKWIDLKREHII